MSPTLRLLPLAVLTASACTEYQTIVVDGRTREYLVHEPSESAPEEGRPVVFVYHGAFTTAAQMQRYAELDTVADKEGFLVVYPNGVNRLWYDGRIDDRVDDVAFTDALLDRIAEDFDIDEARVYATGISNGGFMSYRVACDLSDRFTAIAPVAATFSQELRDMCAPLRPAPVLTIMGTQDKLVPYEGGKLGGQLSGELGTMLSAEESIDWWATRAGCEGEPVTRTFDEVEGDDTKVQTRTWASCPSEIEMILYTIRGGGHTWPGAKPTPLLGKTSEEIDAGQTMWAFFERFSLP